MASRYFPHAGAGFRWNPFRAQTDAEWADGALVTPEIVAAFDQGDGHLQVLGGMGAGKTTTLLGLRRLAQEAGRRVGYAYIPEGQDRLTTDPTACDVLLLDEAQRLSYTELAHLLDRCTGAASGSGAATLRLVFASHRDLHSEFARRRLPLTTFQVDALSLDGWRAILDARLTSAALPGKPHATLSDDAVALLAVTFGTNRRAAVMLLYEVFQRLREPVVVDAPLVQAALTETSA